MRNPMLLRTAIALFVLTLLAGLGGFAGPEAHAATLLQTLFFGFLSGFLVVLVTGLATERKAS
jgi:uncharacterized membrane protein YtjA (UPF0391 family)